MNGQECSSTSEKKIAYFDRKMMILNFSMCCQFKDFKAYFPFKKFPKSRTKWSCKEKKEQSELQKCLPCLPLHQACFQGFESQVVALLMGQAHSFVKKPVGKMHRMLQWNVNDGIINRLKIIFTLHSTRVPHLKFLIY